MQSEQSEISDPKTPHITQRNPTKHARSDFIDQADEELDNWIANKGEKGKGHGGSLIIFRIIEPIFRIKNKKLKSGLY